MRNITVQRPFRVRLQKENTKYSRTTAINVRLQNKKCEIEPYTLSQTYMVRKDFFMYLNYYIQQLRLLIYTVPVMLIAITVHEFAHGWVSYKLGDPTPKYEGRLSLNPLRHLDLIGTLCLLFFHMGWASL